MERKSLFKVQQNPVCGVSGEMIHATTINV